MLNAVNAVVYGLLGVVSLLFWRRRRSESAAWLAVTFSLLAISVIQGLVLPPVEGTLEQFSPREVLSDLSGALLLAFPFALHRFTGSLRPRTGWLARAIDGGMVLVVVSLFALPPFPPNGPDTAYSGVAVLAYLLWWGGLLGSVTWRLWRLGGGQPGVVRNRMRLMSAAALLMNTALLVGFVVPESAADVTTVLATMLGWASAAAFLVAVEPTAILRRLWRTREEDELRVAEARLVAATSRTDAAESVVRPAAMLVGGDAAEVRSTADRERLATYGNADGSDDALWVDGEHVSVAVHRSSLTPVFGEGEEALLRQLCGHLDLSVGRIASFEASERARRAAERANAELTQLVYGVSHDLRNPLVTVLGFIDYLSSDTSALNDTQTMALERIGVSARYMEGLIDDLLQLSRVGRTDAETETLSVAEVVEDIVVDLAARHGRFHVDVDGDGLVDMNPVRMRQLFTNLLENAVRYAGVDEVQVTVTCRATAGGMVTVEVADNGVGIAPEDRDRVFQIFQRLDRFDAAQEGSGIGLTMCRRIAEDRGGSIVLLDVPHGATFRVTLPAAAAAAEDAPASLLPSPHGV